MSASSAAFSWESPGPTRPYRYYNFVMATFVTLLLCSNLIGAGKVGEIGGMKVSAAIYFFPLSYLLGDVLTEVYGYARDRRALWAGFSALVFSSILCWFTVNIPAAAGWHLWMRTIGSTWWAKEWIRSCSTRSLFTPPGPTSSWSA